MIVSLLAASVTIASPAPAEEAVVARVGARAITAAELEKAAARRLIEARSREHDLKRQALDELVEGELLRQEAARRGITVEGLLQAEVNGRASPFGPWDVAAYRDANRAAFEGKSEAEASAEAGRLVRQRRLAQRRFGFLAELRARPRAVLGNARPAVRKRGPAGARRSQNSTRARSASTEASLTGAWIPGGTRPAGVGTSRTPSPTALRGRRCSSSTDGLSRGRSPSRRSRG